jgi:hypothetical protein
MNLPTSIPPAGAEVLQAGGRGGTGNVLYFFPREQPPLVLKVYRPRRSRWNEFWKDISERVFEGKRGATAAIRCATERLILDLWAREGFDVIRRVERPLPGGGRMPALWLAYCQAPVLSELLANPDGPLEGKLRWVELLGQSLSRRHSRAAELHEPLLVHEHGQIKHFFAQGTRLVAFDMEHGYRPGYPVVRAVARELAGIACSLARADDRAGDQYLRVFAASYENRSLAKEAVREAIRGGGLAGIIRRRHDRQRGSRDDKTQVMERMAGLLELEARRAE